MLSTPNVGWSRITIGEWADRCSYLDDVPFMLLEAIAEAAKTLGLDSGSIAKVCQGKRKSCGGFIWKEK